MSSLPSTSWTRDTGHPCGVGQTTRARRSHVTDATHVWHVWYVSRVACGVWRVACRVSRVACGECEACVVACAWSSRLLGPTCDAELGGRCSVCLQLGNAIAAAEAKRKTSKEEVTKGLMSAKLNRDPGLDGITAELIRAASHG